MTVKDTLQPDDDAVVPRIRLGEVGITGLKISDGKILEEANKAFRYPYFLKTVQEMRINPTVAAALNVYKMLMTRPKWSIEAPVGASEEQKDRAKYLEQVMKDMDHSWEDFISSVVPYLEYGFGINEKVFRRRLTSNGSKYNDGLVGIKKLSPRSQATISAWNYSDDGREFLGIDQSLDTLTNPVKINFSTSNGEAGKVTIPKEKFLHFRVDSSNDNPEGNSILKPIYLAYKRLEQLTDVMMLGVAKDNQGLPVLTLPPAYMDANASPDKKAVYTAFCKIADNLANGTQRSMVIPQSYDIESKLPLFTVDLLASKGTAKIDVLNAIKALRSEILTALNADVVTLGSESQGSFSLADSKTSLLSLAVDKRLSEIASVLNTDLIPQLYALNGWKVDEELPKFVYGDTEEIDLAEFSAAVQRIFAVDAVEVDREVLNKIRKVLGVNPLPDDKPVDKESLPSNQGSPQTRSGDGMGVGVVGDGTSKSPKGSGDSSVANKSNKA